MIKIYRLQVLSHRVRIRVSAALLAEWPAGAYAVPCGIDFVDIVIRGEFLYEKELTDKQVQKMMPAWAKACGRKLPLPQRTCRAIAKTCARTAAI